MKSIKLMAVLLAAAGLSACSTIHFKNGAQAANKAAYEEWHHNAAFSLVEISQPIDLAAKCNGKNWTEVTTQKTFLNGLAGSIDTIIVGVDLWEPYTVTYTCS